MKGLARCGATGAAEPGVGSCSARPTNGGATNEAFHPTEPIRLRSGNDRKGGMKSGAECRRWVQKGDDPGNAPQRASCADSGHFDRADLKGEEHRLRLRKFL